MYQHSNKHHLQVDFKLSFKCFTESYVYAYMSVLAADEHP